MRILACRNFRITYPLAHFETFSAAAAPGFPLAPGFPGTVGQFSRRSLAQVRAPVAAGHDRRVAAVAIAPAPLRANVSAGHLIADRMGLRCGEIFSSVHVQSHAIRLCPKGFG
jgi:hypothetical protein